MPNSVEVANGTNPNAPDSNGDVNGNGYTNIEDWFNGLTPAAPTDPDPPSNTAPVVNAGPDQAITLPATATMAATVTDDGLPMPPGVTYLWATESGPAAASFASATVEDPTVTFPVAGTYVLRLTANDGALSAHRHGPGHREPGRRWGHPADGRGAGEREQRRRRTGRDQRLDAAVQLGPRADHRRLHATDRRCAVRGPPGPPGCNDPQRLRAVPHRRDQPGCCRT